MLRYLRRVRIAFSVKKRSTIIASDVERKTLKANNAKPTCQVPIKAKELKKPYITRALEHRAADYHSSRTMYQVSERHLIYP